MGLDNHWVVLCDWGNCMQSADYGDSTKREATRVLKQAGWWPILMSWYCPIHGPMMQAQTTGQV